MTRSDHSDMVQVETNNAMQNLAQTSWAFFEEALRLGFARDEALGLLSIWFNNTTSAFMRPPE